MKKVGSLYPKFESKHNLTEQGMWSLKYYSLRPKKKPNPRFKPGYIGFFFNGESMS